jgi:hypothetical protein
MRHRRSRSRSSPQYSLITMLPDWTVATAVCAWALAAWVSVPVLSLLGALPLIFWLPGNALLRLTRSRGLRWAKTHPPERSTSTPSSASTYREGSATEVFDIAMSTALSAAITIFVGLALALATGHLLRVEAVTMLAALTVGFSLLAQPMSPASSDQTPNASRTGWSPQLFRWIVPTLITCCFLAGILGYLGWRLYVTPLPGQAFTVLSLENEHGERVIQVINDESTTMSFRLEVSQGGHVIADRGFQLRVGGEYDLVVPGRKTTNTEIARLMIEPSNKTYRTIVL